jgi:Domain of unknown function (DUF3854)
LVSQGACTIALMGVDGFRGTNAHGGKVILPDWEYVALNGRTVFVVFDSDIYHKPEVERALKALYALLRSKAAIPRLVQWPQEYRQEKWGCDDFLARGHTLQDLLAMVPPQGPLPARPGSPPMATCPAPASRQTPPCPTPTIPMPSPLSGTMARICATAIPGKRGSCGRGRTGSAT